MCMIDVRTIGFPKRKIAWKVLRYYDRRWHTAIQREPIEGNKLKAIGEPNIIFSRRSKGYILNGGAIHCFRTKRAAQNFTMTDEDIFQVIGKNPIAYNSREIAFEEIEFVDTLNDWEV